MEVSLQQCLAWNTVTESQALSYRHKRDYSRCHFCDNFRFNILTNLVVLCSNTPYVDRIKGLKRWSWSSLTYKYFILLTFSCTKINLSGSLWTWNLEYRLATLESTRGYLHQSNCSRMSSYGWRLSLWSFFLSETSRNFWVVFMPDVTYLLPWLHRVVISGSL